MQDTNNINNIGDTPGNNILLGSLLVYIDLNIKNLENDLKRLNDQLENYTRVRLQIINKLTKESLNEWIYLNPKHYPTSLHNRSC